MAWKNGSPFHMGYTRDYVLVKLAVCHGCCFPGMKGWEKEGKKKEEGGINSYMGVIYVMHETGTEAERAWEGAAGFGAGVLSQGNIPICHDCQMTYMLISRE